MMIEYVVELEDGVWLADEEGDPGRTLKATNAKVFQDFEVARCALAEARTFRAFKKSRMVESQAATDCGVDLS